MSTTYEIVAWTYISNITFIQNNTHFLVKRVEKISQGGINYKNTNWNWKNKNPSLAREQLWLCDAEGPLWAKTPRFRTWLLQL